MMNARSSERGAVLIHVAVAIVALMAFSTLAIDYGVMWVSRREAQNSADAGALAAAIALAFDDPTDFTTAGPAKQSALQYSQTNLVWGQAPDVQPDTDITFPPCPDEPADTCVRVDVYRNQARSNPLPMFFGQLVGLTDQGVRATATARVLNGNATNCMRPWAVADKWDEYEDPGEPDYPAVDPDWDYLESYDTYAKKNQEADLYVTPTSGDPGTGFRVYDDSTTPWTWVDYGTMLVLKTGDPQDQMSAGWFLPVRLGNSSGGDDYRENIAGCIGVTQGIGDVVDVEPGNMIGPTRQGTLDLIALDPNAIWGGVGDYSIHPSGKGTILNSDYAVSPRIVPLPVFNPQEYMAAGPTGLSSLTIRNILGFFVEGMSGNDVVGYLVTVPGELITSNTTVDAQSAFLKKIILVR